MILQRLFTVLLIILVVEAVSCWHEKIAISTSLYNAVSGPGRTLWWVSGTGEEAIGASGTYYFIGQGARHRVCSQSLRS
jgi:hypothetical protein